MSIAGFSLGEVDRSSSYEARLARGFSVGNIFAHRPAVCGRGLYYTENLRHVNFENLFSSMELRMLYEVGHIHTALR